MKKWISLLLPILLLTSIFSTPALASLQCDFSSDVGLTYMIDGKQTRPPEDLFAQYNASFVRAALIKGKTLLQVSHIGGAEPTKHLRIPMGEKVDADFKFPKPKDYIKAKAGITDDGVNYFITMEFEINGKSHTPVWKCK